MPKRLVVFDFCETLVNFQTADAFVDFVIEKENINRNNWIRWLTSFMVHTRMMAVIHKFFPELNLSKRFKLYQIKGVAKDDITKYSEKFYAEKISNNLIENIYELFLKHIANGDYVMIVSGGYVPYIKTFSEKHRVASYFATQIEFRNDKVSGYFLGKDCLFQQKVVLIDDFIKKHNFVYQESIAYSDSFTDLPLLKWADVAFVVSKQKSQAWAQENNFNEIIWNND